MTTMAATSVSPSTWNRFDAPVTEAAWRFVIRVWVYWFALITIWLVVVQQIIESIQWSAEQLLLLGAAITVVGSSSLCFLQWRAARRLHLGGMMRVRQGAVLNVSDVEVDQVIERLRGHAGRILGPKRDGELIGWSVPSNRFFEVRVRRVAPGILRVEGGPRFPTASVDQGVVLDEVLRVVRWYEAWRDDPTHEFESR